MGGGCRNCGGAGNFVQTGQQALDEIEKMFYYKDVDSTLTTTK
jgi:hypothetical protein